MKVKLWDIIIIISVITIICIYSFSLINPENSTLYLNVRSEGKEFIYPLDQDLEVDFTGLIGDTHVVISGGVARITDSPCKNKSCIKVGDIHSTGQSSACLPNRLIITIQGGNSSEVDAVSY